MLNYENLEKCSKYLNTNTLNTINTVLRFAEQTLHWTNHSVVSIKVQDSIINSSLEKYVKAKNL